MFAGFFKPGEPDNSLLFRLLRADGTTATPRLHVTLTIAGDVVFASSGEQNTLTYAANYGVEDTSLRIVDATISVGGFPLLTLSLEVILCRY